MIVAEARRVLGEVKRVATLMDVTIEEDAKKLDEVQFTPQGLGPVFGEILATQQAQAKLLCHLTDVVGELLREVSR